FRWGVTREARLAALRAWRSGRAQRQEKPREAFGVRPACPPSAVLRRTGRRFRTRWVVESGSERAALQPLARIRSPSRYSLRYLRFDSFRWGVTREARLAALRAWRSGRAQRQEKPREAFGVRPACPPSAVLRRTGRRFRTRWVVESG